MGRLNIATASAALSDRAQVVHTRAAVARERTIWLSVLRDLNLPHTDARANFIFFDAGRPKPQLVESLRFRGVDIGRAHPPYTKLCLGDVPEEREPSSGANMLTS